MSRRSGNNIAGSIANRQFIKGTRGGILGGSAIRHAPCGSRRQNRGQYILDILAGGSNRTRAGTGNGQNADGCCIGKVVGEVHILCTIVAIHSSPHAAIIDIGSIGILATGNQRLDDKDIVFLSIGASGCQHATDNISIALAVALYALIMCGLSAADFLQILIACDAVANLERAQFQVKTGLACGRHNIFVGQPIRRGVTPNLNFSLHSFIRHNFPPSKYFAEWSH